MEPAAGSVALPAAGAALGLLAAGAAGADVGLSAGAAAAALGVALTGGLAASLALQAAPTASRVRRALVCRTAFQTGVLLSMGRETATAAVRPPSATWPRLGNSLDA